MPSICQFSLVQSLNHVWLFATPCTAAHQASLSITNSQSLLKLMSIDSVVTSNPLISVIPFSFFLQSFPASESFPMSPFYTSGGQSIGASALTSVLPMNIQDWLPLRIDLFDLLIDRGTLRSLSQHHSSKASVLQHSPFFKSNSHIHTWLLEKP